MEADSPWNVNHPTEAAGDAPSQQGKNSGDGYVDALAGGFCPPSKQGGRWGQNQALELTDVAARFIRRGDPLPAIALLSRALEALAGLAAGDEHKASARGGGKR